MRDYEAIIRQKVIPALGTIRVDTLTKSDLDSMHRKMKDTPRRANLTLAVISAMYGWAGLEYPGKKIRLYPENERQRYLDKDELSRLGQAIKDAENSKSISLYSAAALRLLALTGCRKSEILTLQWSHVDKERGLLLLPDSKTGQKIVQLNIPALEVIANIPPKHNNPFVICGRLDGACLVNISKPWAIVRKAAGLENANIHTLRHTFASYARAGGYSLPIIGGLLGHKQAQTTERYAHLGPSPLRQAGEETASTIHGAMSGNVVSIDRKRTAGES